MNFQESIKVCFQKYADFNGNASRPEYWWFFLFLFIASAVLNVISPIISTIFSLATFIPSIAVGARRLHETNRSGWWQLLWLVPIVGWIVIIIFLAQEALPEHKSAE
jgi:uncharacterized membrane protein YhaH (DUF805 family)